MWDHFNDAYTLWDHSGGGEGMLGRCVVLTHVFDIFDPIVSLRGPYTDFIGRKLITCPCCSIIVCGINNYPVDSLVSTIHILINTCKRPYALD